MEPLEQRQLLSGITLGGDGVLAVSGANGQRNTLTVSRNASGNYVASSNAITRTYSAGSVTRINVYGGNWNDTIKVASNVTKPCYVDGGDGNDWISTGA